jgi:hypothetical protein
MLGGSTGDGGLDDFEGRLSVNKVCFATVKLVGRGFDVAEPVVRGGLRIGAFKALDELRGQIGPQRLGKCEGGVEDGSGVFGHKVIMPADCCGATIRLPGWVPSPRFILRERRREVLQWTSTALPHIGIVLLVGSAPLPSSHFLMACNYWGTGKSGGLNALF